MRETVVHILDIFHILVTVFLAVGGYVLPTRYVPMYLLCAPYLVIDWNDTDAACWITKLRNMIRYKSIDPDIKDEIESVKRDVDSIKYRKHKLKLVCMNDITPKVYDEKFRGWMFTFWR